ncbi:O-antigen ligase family protein [Uruburuella testudinis]|uniref:O-antigen ligase family protein n=1 Tax=Uruburuella testudinis TaxID=1282863 RepID=A0ABY4DV90_9NEIS|nr:O-antigen ligase family protein [Uruburuella testudinis]UOO82378.1 O-antigen ligase family protein [Uruburuella testudinis]
MKIKSSTLYLFLTYSMLVCYMLGPTLSYRVGIPRIDNPMTLLFIILSCIAFLLERKDFPKKILNALIPLTIMSGWSLLHILISPMSATLFADLMLFAILPGYFYMLYLVISRHPDQLRFIRTFLLCFSFFITAPAIIELTTGFQFVFGDEAFSLEAGTLKGLFFNPNNLATTTLCITPAVLIFFNLIGRDKKSMLTGWALFILLGVVIFASASRTAIMVYIMLWLLFLVYRQNGLTTLFTLGAAALVLNMIPSTAIQNFLLSLNGNEFLERFSSRLYLFLYDLGSDNSVSYRQEIYNHFWNNPPFLYAGYGPRNFRDYFSGHLSDSLGFTNPHSFLIELYLAFGIVAFLGFLVYVSVYLITCAGAKHYSSKIRFIAVFSMLLFLVAGFIPSTIMRLPFIWLPNFLIFIYIVCNKPQSHHTGATP